MDPLKTLLQLHLASDTSAVLHVSYILSSLTPNCFLPSPHIQKWTTRVGSLMHSKDPGARWAGLCIAQKTAVLSKAIMIDCAQSWLSVALPMLSRSEPAPTLKAAMRLLIQIFNGATDVPEFQRQVSTPNVPKFSAALISLAEKNGDREVKLVSISTLSRLIPLYPTLHRSLHTALQSLSLKFLNGSAPKPSDTDLVYAASQLYTVLHLTGGKVGAANLWRKSLDETVAFSRSAFFNLRTTFPVEGRNSGSSTEDPVVWIPLNTDRLRCGVIIICDLLRSATHRPIQLPVGLLVRLTMELLSATAEEQVDGHIDPGVHAMEVAALPYIWQSGCDLLICLAKSARHHLTPAQTRILSYLIYHLEQPLIASQRLPFIRATHALLTYCQPPHAGLLPTRLAKALLTSLTGLLSTQSDAQPTDAAAGGKSGKGKKRARGYEGDEVFKTTRAVICAGEVEGEVVVAALEALQLVLRCPHLTPAVHSITSRVLLSLLLALPQMLPAALAPNPQVYGRVLAKVHEMSVELAVGTTSAMSKSLGLVIQLGGGVEGGERTFLSAKEVQRNLDLLLHPRVPPLLRSLPHVEALSLFRAEESHDEFAVRESLGLGAAEAHPAAPVQPGALHAPSAIATPDLPEAPPAKTLFTMDAPPDTSSKVSAPEPKVAQATLLAPTPTLPPHPAQLPTPPPPASKTPLANEASLQTTVVAAMDEDEDEAEEMPAIDMDSDSD
ncbi:hypothetical protein FIBSPDRAFT_951090 [Athelia psychrophila]|uniref:Pre-rRNA-processing protein RIX1 n=1 Tax=Athelia psychrophila TaxID=1759441 RepID=A0A166N6L4_9AGAM|nr:hypothetical protein FIBSPDRAFT_951090 [Fibularhizoctonia sp. CBS 109695]